MENTQHKIRKRIQGVVVSDKGTNTIKVRVEQKYPDPLYKKIVKHHKYYLVQCTVKNVEVGDKVIIEEGRPVSKRKSFYFIKKIGK
ncbi:MAG TPA: uS17 family ribosomal protein [Candidatus Dojkabacteria bacterium]|nr:uS17 family ribosomal protein [Candidatus Dojkabacteria bacterium]